MTTALFRQRRFNNETFKWEEIDVPVEVGDGVSYGIGSDAYPYTVRKISPNGKTLWCSRDEFEAGSGTFISHNGDRPECWSTFTKRKNGRWIQKGDSLDSAGCLSAGRAYKQDPHF